MQVYQTLLEHMKLTEIEICNRLELLAITPKLLAELSSYKPIIEEHLDEIVNDFYQKQTQIEEISLLIGDVDTLNKLHEAQKNYVLDLFDGHYGAEYVNNRLRIGLVHKRIGVEPKLYLSAVLALKTILMSVLQEHIPNPEHLASCLSTLDKLFYFDTTLVFDTYIDSLISEIENAKHKVERYAQSLEVKVAERTQELERQALLDSLTNLYNQRALRELMYRDLQWAKRQVSSVCLVYFDVDDFKAVNDIQGHLKGDAILRAIGDILLTHVRETDVACRYGGDEFCVVLRDCVLADAKAFCQKIMDDFAMMCPNITLSFGLCETGPKAFLSIDDLIRCADKQMYLAKKTAGFKVCWQD